MSMKLMEVTRYEVGEEPALHALYAETTRRINGKDYTAEQCERWATQITDLAEWAARVRTRNPLVARQEGKILGFAELDEDGHVDYFYVHHEWQRRGVGRSLYRAIEEEAHRKAMPELRLESSVTALPFFLSMGFQVTEREEAVICGALAVRFRMVKRLVLRAP